MIALDASVAVKWFKPGERFQAEAEELLNLLSGFRIEAIGSEWLPLEVVRGLKRAQQEVPDLAIEDSDIHAAYDAIVALHRCGALLEVPVGEVRALAKNAEISLGLYAADAVHLATAVHLGARLLVTDDHHLLSPLVKAYAAPSGVAVVDPQDAVAALKV
ncbi:MAG: type II toxin-antitoxin system VapC family toxin [Armatimonadetes bacterium]|nr:type II toxin-antitoxin system VapC family toxin [Armatimonadota bacterium]